MTARDEFEGGAVVLRDLGLAYAAESHIRNLLGCMAHTAWVTCMAVP